MEWIGRVPRRVDRAARVLDVAMGRGRHAIDLARAGFHVFGIDRDRAAMRDAMNRAAAQSTHLACWCADLTSYPLASNWFDVIVVTRYLQRDLFSSLADALVPGGTLVYETFTTAQRALGSGPTSADHLLEPGELRRAFGALEMLHYEEVASPEAVARLAARRRA